MHRISCWQRVFDDVPRGTVAVFCSDGRYSRYIDEFLESLLRLEGADWLAVPGGPAALAGVHRNEEDAETLWRHIEFLVSRNEVRRVILIFHENCRYYRDTLACGMAPEEARRKASEDAERACTEVRRRFPQVTVEAYWHDATDTAVFFRTIPEETVEAEQRSRTRLASAPRDRA